MTHARVQDKFKGRNSRRIDRFYGRHGGIGRTDQNVVHASVVDLDCVEDKLQLRDGSRKNSLNGFSASVQGGFHITLGGRNLVGFQYNGQLAVEPVADMLAGTLAPYTWGELLNDGTTWQDLSDDSKSWGDLLEGNR